MVGIHSEVGNYRKINQDSIDYSLWNGGGIFVVADGMGGYAGGEVASKIAVEKLIEEILKHDKDGIDEEEIKHIISKCNEEIYSKSNEYEELKGMGTTITFCFLQGNKALIGNIGDSCCYVLEKSVLRKVTKDHSLVQAFVDSGSLTEEEAKLHPNKNIITRSLGTSKEVECDIYKEQLGRDSIIVLCSDGLSNHIENERMKEIILKHSEEKSVKILADLSKENGSRDNISVMVFKGECGDDR